MARIRTIKPEFFRHEGLYDAERETGLPLRIAFAGLWTAADKAGRFEWRPRQLKLDCLPHDDVDFSRVLDALATRGFIVKYTSGGEEYGYIPSWRSHQVINNRETESKIPEPNKIKNIPTRQPRVDDASATRQGNYQGEGEGEGNVLITAVDGISTPASDVPKSGGDDKPQPQDFAERIAVECKRAGLVESPSNPEIIARWIREGATPCQAAAALAEGRKSVKDGDLRIALVDTILARNIDAERKARAGAERKVAEAQRVKAEQQAALLARVPPPAEVLAKVRRHG